MADSGHREAGASLAARVDTLFRKSRPEGRRWTNDEVADSLKRTSPGLRVSGAYLSAIRTGKRTKPSTDLLAALASFFGVSLAYFFDIDHADQVNAQLTALDELSQAGVRSVALRSIGLSQDSLDVVLAVLDQVRERQGLPPAPDVEHGK
jgi:transcriptional regulator with XRE-family HTH domain